MITPQDQQTINDLQANWVWVPDWVDSSTLNTAGRIVRFTRSFDLPQNPDRAILHLSADTRYKLYVNETRVAVGPSRSSPAIWYYDTIDISPYLRAGTNDILIVVARYFASSRGGMPFERTALPGLTTVGNVEAGGEAVNLSSTNGWEAQVQDNILFPMGLIDDVFLHINERINSTTTNTPAVSPVPYNIKTLNGELSTWRLRPRAIPMQETSLVGVQFIQAIQTDVQPAKWEAWLSNPGELLTLPAGSTHSVELKAEVHSTAFVKWSFMARGTSRVKLKVTYSEGYELEPRSYPFFRSKANRLDSQNGHLLGPYDEVEIELPAGKVVTYEPFWFRTFRIMRAEISVTGSDAVDLVSFEATQVNYPLSVKGSWDEPGDAHSKKIWEVSIRTMRNCMFDGYSDCPFYEQLQYAGDTRSVALFHYFLSGDDRLMRQAITNFAASVTTEGLTQSRFPSHVPQVIAGFSLYWILQVCDHYLFFGDRQFARSFVPRIDGVLDFFDAHVDHRGLISDISEDVWQYVDWVTTWGATEDHPDKGVPTSGRKSNCHTYFSMLYAYVLKQAAELLRHVGRPGNADEYLSRSASVVRAIQTHCYDGRFFTDSTADIADDLAYSQHCQVFAVLSGAAAPEDYERLLTESIKDSSFSKCSYYMRFYLFRALSLAGDTAYESFWTTAWEPWKQMLANNLTTWEEDDVRQRSDCHSWSSVPVYEYYAEVAGIHPIAPGSTKLLFKPRLKLSQGLTAKIAIGLHNLATVSWTTGGNGEKYLKLNLQKPVEVVSQMPGEAKKEHGVVDEISLVYNVN